jgi:hypothetical protein
VKNWRRLSDRVGVQLDFPALFPFSLGFILALS